MPRAADPPTLQSLAGRTMGTTWSLRIDNRAMLALDLVRDTVVGALDRVVAQMSTWETDSALSRFNLASPGSRHIVDVEFTEVLASALDWAERTRGAIDPTVGPLVAAWGFGAHAPVGGPAPPSPAAVDAALGRVGWRRITFDRTARSLMQPGGVTLDFSGIAKGFAVDLVAAHLEAIGLADFLIEIGGELRANGRRHGGVQWQVEVEATPAMRMRIALDDMAVATSGDRWHAHEHRGQRWAHTIDPRTGRPVAHDLASVTVLHRRCMDADALATALTVLGPIAGLEFADRNDIAALFVRREGPALATSASRAWPHRVA